eukprot:6482686-Amphidinium_carterae.3
MNICTAPRGSCCDLDGVNRSGNLAMASVTLVPDNAKHIQKRMHTVQLEIDVMGKETKAWSRVQDVLC